MKRSNAPSLKTSSTSGSSDGSTGIRNASVLPTLSNTRRGRGRTALVRSKSSVPMPVDHLEPTPPPLTSNHDPNEEMDNKESETESEDMFEKSASNSPVAPVAAKPSLTSERATRTSVATRQTSEKAAPPPRNHNRRRSPSSTSITSSDNDDEIQEGKTAKGNGSEVFKEKSVPHSKKSRQDRPALTETSNKNNKPESIWDKGKEMNSKHALKFRRGASRVSTTPPPEAGQRASSTNRPSTSPSSSVSSQHKRPRISIRRSRSASIFDSDDSDNDAAAVSKNQTRNQKACVPVEKSKTNKVESESESSNADDLSESLLESSSSPVGESRMVSTHNSTNVTSCSGGNKSRTQNVSSASSVDSSKYNRNDPDWSRFYGYVHNSPASAADKLTSEILGLERGSTSSALIGKLIYRTLAELEMADSELKEVLQKCAFTIIRSVLQLTTQADNNIEVVSESVNMMFTELRHFPTQILQTIADSCLEYIKKYEHPEGSLPPRWIEVFGKVVSVLITKGDIKHETDILDGKAYREHIVSEICRLNWTSENAASLIAVLREIQGIEDSEIKIILCQVKSCIHNIKASAFPPIIHQLLLLAGSRCPSELLSLSAQYFKTETNDPELTHMQEMRKRNALGTVVFHFLEAARHCDSIIRAVYKIVKASVFDFREVMCPFVLSVVLGLTSLEHAKHQIIELLRGSIVHSFHCTHGSRMSYWQQQTIGILSCTDRVTDAFKTILEAKSSTVEVMLDGLQALGIGLLKTDSIANQKYSHATKECQKLGSYILQSVVKYNEDQLPALMDQLMKVSRKSIIQIECLANCMEMKTRRVIHPSVIGKTCEIVRYLPMMDSDSAELIIKGLSAALQLNYILLDQLMIILRKTIWKSVEARRTAARVMIILLSNSKVVGDIPSSQYSESQRFYQSQNQLPPGQLPDSQPLCMEVLSLAKRCFNQQCEIRKELYLGYHTVVRRNPGLCELLCNQILKHGALYLAGELNEGDDAPHILLKRTVEFSANDNLNPVTIKEELGFMVQCLSKVARRSAQAFSELDDGPPVQVAELLDLLKRWTRAVLDLVPETIEQAAAESLSEAEGGSWPLDILRFVETAFTIQALQVIEALIEHFNYDETRENDRIVKKLFEKLNALEPLLQKKKDNSTNKKGKGNKGKGKTNKGKGKAKDDSDIANDDSESVADTASLASGSQGGGFKKPELAKKLVHFHIFTLDGLLDMLKKLYKSEDDKCPLTSIHRSTHEFEKLLLSTVKQKLSSFKQEEPLHERRQRSETVAKTFADIASAIWTSFYNERQDLDTGMIAVIGFNFEFRLEVISEITKHLCSSYKSVCAALIRMFGDVTDADVSFDDAFPNFFRSWKNLLKMMPSASNFNMTEIDEEPDRNLHKNLFEILHWFSIPKSPETQQRSVASEVVDWLWQFMASTSGKDGKPADFVFADAVLSCWLVYFAKCKGFLEQPGGSQHDVLSLARFVRVTLGVNTSLELGQPELDSLGLNKDPNPGGEMWIVNQETAPNAAVLIMEYIELMLTYINALVTKLKCPKFGEEATYEKETRIREKCFNFINEIISVSFELVPCAFPTGLCANTMLRVVPQIFNVMTGFGEYFMELSKTKHEFSFKGFTEPVSRIGKYFTAIIHSMVKHIESLQRQQVLEEAAKTKATAAGNKKKKGGLKTALSSTLKNQLLMNTKLIPNLTHSTERYDQKIIQLSNKLKDKKGAKLLVGMKLVSAFDFKLDSEKLAEALNETRSRSVQDITSVPNDETVYQPAVAEPTPGPSRRPRKGRKRKSIEELVEDDSEVLHD